ncbi:MAG: hypothetical protein IJH39_07945 [Clostridia bacterium]|nr:hypothetical protein [Clostridia bacterium]
MSKFRDKRINRTITSVTIDKDKWDIIKSKGYNLQDIVDNAFNNILDIDGKEPSELLKEKEKVECEIEQVEKEFKEQEKRYNETLDSLNSYLKELDKKIKSDVENKEKEDDYKTMYEIFSQEYGNYKDPNVNKWIVEYSEKYNIDYDGLLEELINKLNDEF